MDLKLPLVGAMGCCLLLTVASVAADASNPYGVIAERNVFHLNPPPPPPEAPEPTKADLPPIKITGIIKIQDKTRVLFVSQPKNPKDAPTYFNLGEGEREGILEVVKIYPDDQKVDVINSGMALTLTMKDDTLAKNEGPPPAAAPGPPGERRAPPPFPSLPSAPGMGNRRIPAPALPGMAAEPVRNGSSPFAFPMRTRRTPVGPGQ